MSGNLRFIDALVEAVERRGLKALPVYTSSLRALNDAGTSAALSFFKDANGPRIDALINTTSFALGDINPQGPTLPGRSIEAMEDLDVPVFQAMVSGMELAQWQGMSRGLNPLDTAMNVVIPEFDGRIVTVPVSFKAKRQSGGMEVVEYVPLADRVERVAGIVAAQVRLRRLAPGAIGALPFHLYQLQHEGLADRQRGGAGCAGLVDGTSACHAARAVMVSRRFPPAAMS